MNCSLVVSLHFTWQLEVSTQLMFISYDCILDFKMSEILIVHRYNCESGLLFDNFPERSAVRATCLEVRAPRRYIRLYESCTSEIWPQVQTSIVLVA